MWCGNSILSSKRALVPFNLTPKKEDTAVARKKAVVGPDLTPDWLEKRRNVMGEIDAQLIWGLCEPGKGLTLDQLQIVIEHRNPFEVVKTVTNTKDLVSRTTKLLSKKFGYVVEVDPLPPEFTPANLAKWALFNLRPVFLPGVEIGEDSRLKNWIKPNPWFYQQIKAGKLASDSATLYRGWYLADFTVGTDYTDGTQVFTDDPLAPIITRLREDGQVGKHNYTPLGSRFSITHNEWTSVVLPAIAEHLGFKREQVRLERVIEFNAIGNLYDSNRGKHNMWEWFHNVFEDSHRLGGGYRVSGGLANVNDDWSDYRYDVVAARPLVSFVK
ncbi:MAG: hypothetical protein HY452_01395 [Parcubacteria group bacterium]|nr:hypothetical protein [Parcubacteria group bacterium]